MRLTARSMPLRGVQWLLMQPFNAPDGAFNAAARRSKFKVVGEGIIMGSIKKFEDIEAWVAARELTRQVYEISKLEPLCLDYGLKDQMQRASGSIMANIAEGFERGSNREFIQFLYIAKSSAGELRSHFYIALDQNYIDRNTFNTQLEQLNEISRKLSRFIAYLSQSPMKGSKR